MPVTVTVDPDFIYAMLKEYNDALQAYNIGGAGLYERLLYLLYDSGSVYWATPNCSVSAVPGGAKIVCTLTDASGYTHTVNGAWYMFTRHVENLTYSYELFKVSFPAVTKGSSDTLTVTATAVLTVG